MSEAGTGAVPGCWLGWVGLRHPQLPQKREGLAPTASLTVPVPRSHPFSVASEIACGRKSHKAGLDMRWGYAECVRCFLREGEEAEPGS